MPDSEDEKSVIEVLQNEKLHQDEIIRLTKLSASKVSATLTVMELKGLIKNLGGGFYKKTLWK